MPMYAIVLTRAIGAVELKAAQQESSLPMASSSDGRRLAVLVSAKSEGKAMRRIWKRLDDALPVDVLCSLFPAPDGSYLMSIPSRQCGTRCGAVPQPMGRRLRNTSGTPSRRYWLVTGPSAEHGCSAR